MPSSNALTLIFFIVAIAGAIVFVVGTMMRREEHARALDARHAPVDTSPQPEPIADVATRIDMVERLVMVGQPWCIEQLNTIRDEDPSEAVREAADAALMVIGSRPPQ